MAQLFARPLCEKIAFAGRRDPTRPWKRCTTCGCKVRSSDGQACAVVSVRSLYVTPDDFYTPN